MPSQIVAILPSHSTTTLSQSVNRHSSAVSYSRLLSTQLIATPSLPVDRHSSLPINCQSTSHLSTTLSEPVYRHSCPPIDHHSRSPIRSPNLPVCLIAAPVQPLIATLTQPFKLSSLSPVHLLPCQIPVTGLSTTVDTQTRGIACRTPTPCVCISQVKLAARSCVSQAPHSRRTRPCTAISPLLIRLTRSQESESPSFKPHLCLPEG